VNNSWRLFKTTHSQKTTFVTGVESYKSILIMKLNQSTLDKLEDILGESDFVVRYERGNFQSGWCLLEAKRIVVLNKFLSLEGRINTLLELIPVLDIQFDKLTHASQVLYNEVKKLTLTEANKEETAA
jgi:hypothetical protein